MPNYFEENSINHLNNYAADFKGGIVGVEQGAGIMTTSEAAIETYGLDYNLVGSSDPAMIAALYRAIDKQANLIGSGNQGGTMF